MNKIFFLVTALFILTAGKAQTNIGTDTTTVIILSANDMHAKIDNFPKFKALVDNYRQHYENVLVVSAGDMFTGNPIVDQYPDKGFPMIELMNRVGFTIGTIGNHEFDYGQETLKRRIAQAQFPLISANIASPDSIGINPDAYRIVSLNNGIKIGFVGAIQLNSEGLPDSHPSKLGGIQFTDGITRIKEYRSLRDSCNIFVGLTHLGFEDDVELANQFGEFDVILGGHSHTLVTNPVEYNSVLVMQAGSSLKNLGLITIKLVGGKVVSKKAELISVLDYPEVDSTLLSIVDRFNDNKELNKVIGTAQNDITGNDELGSLMTDGMCSLDEIEIAFQNVGGIRVDILPKGNITIKDVYKLDPFGNEIILLKMNVSEIKSLILNAFNREKAIDLGASGIAYTVIANSKGIGTEVKLFMPDGSDVDASKVFATGLSSYIVSSYDFKHEDPGQSLYTTTAQALINFISAKKEVNYTGIKRVSVSQKAD